MATVIGVLGSKFGARSGRLNLTRKVSVNILSECGGQNTASKKTRFHFWLSSSGYTQYPGDQLIFQSYMGLNANGRSRTRKDGISG